MFDSFSNSRYRRQVMRRRRIGVAVVFFACCFASYWVGGENVRYSELAYKETAIKARNEKEGLEQQITSLHSQVQSADVRFQQLAEKYKREVPQGDFKQITDLVRKQLDAGIKPERLTLAIESARPPRNCTDPLVKRFVMKTPVYSGPQGAVSFGNGVVTVAGEGSPSVSPTGNAEAWYDPGKPVKILFTEIGGKQTVKSGLLPIQNSLVVGNKEYRFTVAAGERSFISVTADSCDYP
jgi:hypothetical protein